MRTKDVFNAALKATGMTQIRLSQLSGEPEQSIGQKINVRETIKLRDFIQLLYYTGICMRFFKHGKKKEFLEIYSAKTSIKEMFAVILKELDIGLDKAAQETGYEYDSLRYKINIRESIQADEFLELVDALGIDVKFYIKERNQLLTKELAERKRITGMADRVIYDTMEAQLLASSFYADGKNEYGPDGKALELYVDKENRYFAVEYSEDTKDKGKIRSMSSHMAAAVIAKYGIKAEDEIPV